MSWISGFPLRRFVCLLLFSFSSFLVFAQPANDECDNAIFLPDVSNYCSDVAEFTTNFATSSPQANPTCFPDVGADVWFEFVATAIDINISVIGALNVNAGGTLEDPQVALYSGNCAAPNQLACISDAFNNNQIQTFGGPLNIGEVYYLRVSARNGNTGTFQLCVNNFNQVPDPSGDCNSAVILCNKDPFTVDIVQGAGSDPTELNTGSVCDNPFTGCFVSEDASSWYKWTCDQAGSLTFNLTPLNPADDLDFILYELPNGIDDCSGKEELRCMFSGQNVGESLANWINCTGATGLQGGDPDTGETCGCQDGNNNYSSAVNLISGRSYALVVLNFSNSGSGFTIDFGGTSTFEGPVADFNVDPNTTICYGASAVFSDNSSFIGIIDSYTWFFGGDATPTTASGPGPHNVTWGSVGVKPVTLIVETDQGCLVTEVGSITVDPCCEDENVIFIDEQVSDLLCPNDQNGSISLTVQSNAPPFTYAWTGPGGFTADTELITNLEGGVYTVTVTNAATCEEVLDIVVNSPPTLFFTPQIVMPTCDGGVDGVLTIQATGGTPPLEFDFGSGFSSNNTLSNIPVGLYPVSIRDANGCVVDTSIFVNELQLLLNADQLVTTPSCFDTFDGAITALVVNGQGPFEYDLGDGNGFTSNNILTGLNSGSFLISYRDANGCTGDTAFMVVPPPPVEIETDTLDISCFGQQDGVATALASGGVGGFTYVWDDPLMQMGPEAVGLSEGEYTVLVEDANGCPATAGVFILEPEEVFVDLQRKEDVLCNGDASGLISVVGSGGTGPYTYSLDGFNFQTDTVFFDIFAGLYEIIVEDSRGCQDTLDVDILEPDPLIVDAGEDQTVNLGETADLQAQTIPPFLPVDYLWGPEGDFQNCIDCPDPEVLPINTSVYTVTVTDANGCTDIDQVTVNVVKIRNLFIPNAFSPNGDGFNDFFTLFGGPAASVIQQLRVFNRWGALIFETENIDLNQEQLGWDGRFKGEELGPDVFAYYALVEFIDGEVVLFEGDITIVK